jgi:hypothetical protein
MKDQAAGYFGWDVPRKKGESEQYRCKAVVDIDEVLSDPRVTTVLDVWAEVRRYPDSQPFSGGVLTDWPAIAVDGLAVCRQEEHAIDDFIRWKEAEHGPESSSPR